MENNKSVTAVKWLEIQLHKIGITKVIIGNQLKEAKKMEEKQHQETFKQSRLVKIFEKDMPPVWKSWEQYYNETFGK